MRVVKVPWSFMGLFTFALDSFSGLDSNMRTAVFICVFIILKCQVQAAPSPSGDDADAGDLREDILEINRGLNHLFDGDIAGDHNRNALLDETKRWKFPVPYILTDSLDLNAKGVILQAFEEYRLRSCVDFKPYEGESTYVSFSKQDGCWSFVGDLKEGQDLSIGAGCDTKAIVEHELLHALGFYHEQSRADRDDYVKIWWDQIEEGREHNFAKYEDDFITDLNTAYDYESIMHYRPLSFNINDSIPTITTTIPEFNDVIGQRLDFSAIDVTRLNRMYDCANSHTLLDQCSFELVNICGMIQNEADSSDWVQTLGTPADPDYTLGGRCKDSGYFMKFDKSTGVAGSSALLESRILYPKRSEQCLQFFYRMTGGSEDRLEVWIRSDDGTGNVTSLKKVHTLLGDADGEWKVAHVPLKEKQKFRYVFNGVRATAASTGAVFIDDITLTEAACPSAVWHVRDFKGLMASTAPGDGVTSRCFQSPEGYAFGISLFPNGNDAAYTKHVGVTVHLCSGENDAVLEWPVQNRQVTVVAMDQDPDVKQRMSNTRSFTTDLDARWSRPTASSGATFDPACNCYRGLGRGWSTFISHTQLSWRSFLKNDDLILTADFNDLTHLIKTEVPVKPPSAPQPVPMEVLERSGEAKPREKRAAVACHPELCLNGGVCVESEWDATCRCATTRTTFYTGGRCEQVNFHRGILGALVGGAVGTVVLTAAIFGVVRRS